MFDMFVRSETRLKVGTCSADLPKASHQQTESLAGEAQTDLSGSLRFKLDAMLSSIRSYFH